MSEDLTDAQKAAIEKMGDSPAASTIATGYRANDRCGDTSRL